MFLTILATTGLSLVLYLTGFFVIFTPLPLLLTWKRKGASAAFASAGAVLAVLAALYFGPERPWGFLPMMVFHPHLEIATVASLSLLYCGYYLFIALLVGASSRRQGQWAAPEPLFAGLTLLSVGIPALILIAGAFLQQTSLREGVAGALNDLMQKMVGLQESAGMSGEDLATLREFAPAVVTRVIGLMPALWIDFSMVVLSLNILFFRRWSGEARPFPDWPDFSLWRLREVWIWVPIAAGGVYFLNRYVLHSEFVGTGVLNILLVTASVAFFQGLSIVSFFFKRKFSPWARLFAYAAVLLFLQVVGLVVIALGLFDFWFDFRKLKKVT